MVAENPQEIHWSGPENGNEQEHGEAPQIRYVPNRRLGTRAAARQAVAIADTFANRRTPDPGAPGLGEQELFVSMHVCAYRALHARGDDPASRPQRAKWLARWKTVRDGVIERNLGLVYTVMERFGRREVDWEDQRSEAMLALMRAVEGFDPWRGIRFSTYAWHAILRSLIQLERQTKRYRLLFPVQYEDAFERPDSDEMEPSRRIEADRVAKAIRENRGDLTDRESIILDWRFPMDGSPGMTLGEVGEAIGLSKERVRQIQNSALGKLRRVLEADPALQ